MNVSRKYYSIFFLTIYIKSKLRQKSVCRIFFIQTSIDRNKIYFFILVYFCKVKPVIILCLIPCIPICWIKTVFRYRNACCLRFFCIKLSNDQISWICLTFRFICTKFQCSTYIQLRCLFSVCSKINLRHCCLRVFCTVNFTKFQISSRLSINGYFRINHCFLKIQIFRYNQTYTLFWCQFFTVQALHYSIRNLNFICCYICI